MICKGFSNWLGIHSLSDPFTGSWCADQLFNCPLVINQHRYQTPPKWLPINSPYLGPIGQQSRPVTDDCPRVGHVIPQPCLTEHLPPPPPQPPYPPHPCPPPTSTVTLTPPNEYSHLLFTCPPHRAPPSRSREHSTSGHEYSTEALLAAERGSAGIMVRGSDGGGGLVWVW